MFYNLPYNMDGAQPELVDTIGDLVTEATFCFPSCYAQISFGDSDKYQKEMLFISSQGEYRSYINVIHQYFGVLEIAKCIKQHDSIGREDKTDKGQPICTLVQGVCCMDHLNLGLLPGTSFKYRLWHVQYPQSECYLRRVKEVVINEEIRQWMKAVSSGQRYGEYESNLYKEIGRHQHQQEILYLGRNGL